MFALRSTGPSRPHRHARTAGLVARLFALALAVALFAPASAVQAANGPSCSVSQGQALINQGRYEQAIREFTCVIDAQPTAVEGYRGSIEAEVLLGRYSDAVRDYQRVTAYVLPVHPDAEATILDGYQARLATAPNDLRALTGESFARWWFFDYAQAIQILNRILDSHSQDPYANLFRGSSRLLSGATKERGVADLDRGIALAPESAHVRFIVADAYTYGLPDPERAFAEATLALDWGLDTPRVHAILATSYQAFGDLEAAAAHIKRSIDLVTTELVTAPSLSTGGSLTLDLVPGRVYEIPLTATAGQPISIATSSRDFWDSIAVLLDPDGTPVVGSDDDSFYFAAFDWVPPASGTYRLRVTSFESVSTGALLVTRD
jgi:tetratricopeptide (TPR) repeat protein